MTHGRMLYCTHFTHQMPRLLCWAVGEGLEDPGGHPPHQRHRPRHNLLPLVLGVLPHCLPRRLPRLQALVTPDMLKQGEGHRHNKYKGQMEMEMDIHITFYTHGHWRVIIPKALSSP